MSDISATFKQSVKDCVTAFSDELIELAKCCGDRIQVNTKEEFFNMFIDSIRNETQTMEFFAQAIYNLEKIGEARAAYAKALEKQQ